MGRSERLLADWNNVVAAVGWIVDKDNARSTHQLRNTTACVIQNLQLIAPLPIHIVCHVNREAKVATSVESRLLSIDEDSSFIVHSVKVEQDSLSSPVGGNLEICLVPRIEQVGSLDSRKATLETEGNENLSWEGLVERRVVHGVQAGGIGVGPDTVTESVSHLSVSNTSSLTHSSFAIHLGLASALGTGAMGLFQPHTSSWCPMEVFEPT